MSTLRSSEGGEPDSMVVRQAVSNLKIGGYISIRLPGQGVLIVLHVKPGEFLLITPFNVVVTTTNDMALTHALSVLFPEQSSQEEQVFGGGLTNADADTAPATADLSAHSALPPLPVPDFLNNIIQVLPSRESVIVFTRGVTGSMFGFWFGEFVAGRVLSRSAKSYVIPLAFAALFSQLALLGTRASYAPQFAAAVRAAYGQMLPGIVWDENEHVD